MGGGSSKTTVNYLISLIDRVHKIYEDTIWRDSPNGQGFSGMGFIIKKIVVHKKPTDVREGEVRILYSYKNFLLFCSVHVNLANYIYLLTYGRCQ